MKTFAIKQPINDFAKQNKQGDKEGRSHSISPLSTGIPLPQRQCACGGGCPRCQDELGIQTKLKISEPGDKYEQEADRIADEVMRMPEPSVQRQVELGEEEEGEEMVQRKAGANYAEHLNVLPYTQETNRVIDSYIGGLRGEGQSLPQSTRTFFEPRFGYDFSQVRIHTDTQAAQAAQAINARAFTSGKDVAFGNGQFQPQTLQGQRLLAHELTHVLQQNEASASAPSVPTIQLDLNDDEPVPGFTCGLMEMSLDHFDDSRSCCAEERLRELERMGEQSVEAMRTAIQRMSSGAAMDRLLRLHFGESGPSHRSTILNNIRRTLKVAQNFRRNNHTFLCRPLSDRFGCRGQENALAAQDTDIIVCMATGRPTFQWMTILHEFFHVSGVADLPLYGDGATPEQERRGEFETYYDLQGAESDDPRWQRYPSAAPLRNADSYRHLVTVLSAPDWSEEETSTRFIPGLNLGAGIAVGGGGVEPVVAARLAFTPLGRGLHFITPGIVGLWMPGRGTVDSTDPNAAQPRAYVGGELGLRYITGTGSVAGVFDLGAGVGSVFRRDESADVGALVRTSAGVRFGRPGIGGSVNVDFMRMFDFVLREQRADGWIIGLSVQGHWGGHSGSRR